MWSKFDEDSLEYYTASLFYESNGLAYHNMDHIQKCYEYLEGMNVPYNEDLDYAVLFHDVVYDENPEKEKRSADFLLERWPTKTKAADIIMATAKHIITPDTDDLSRWMIRADLHALGSVHAAIVNYVNIMAESMYLYDISATEFAENNVSFMLNLRETIVNNTSTDGPEYLDFWNDVKFGVQFTMKLSHTIAEEGK